MWGMSDKNNEKYYLIVFDKDQVFYKKGFSSDLCADLSNIYIFDDKTSTLKKTPSQDIQGFTNNVFWCFGYNEEDESELFAP